MDVLGPAGEAAFQFACIICNWLGGACTGLGCLSQGPGLGDLALGVAAVGALAIGGPGLGGLFLGGVAVGLATSPSRDTPVDHATRYDPGLSPLPKPGDIIYSDGVLPSRVIRTEYVPGEGGRTVVNVFTESGVLIQSTTSTSSAPVSLPPGY